MATLTLVTFAEAIGGITVRYLAAYAKSKGISTQLLHIVKRSRGSFSNARVDKLTELTEPQLKNLLQSLVDTHTEWAGFSLMTNDLRQFHAAVSFLRANKWTGKIIVGGIHPTLRPEETLSDGVDYVVAGPGELALVELLQGKDVSTIGGLVYRRDGEIQRNPILKEAALPLDSLPFPDYELNTWFLIDYDGTLKNITLDLYRDLVTARGKFYYLTTARGCPYRCSYCCNDNRQRVRRTSVEYSLAELRYAKTVLPFTKGINVMDDSFFMGSDQWLKEFCARAKAEFNWPLIIRIMPRFATRERLMILKEAGLSYVSIGLQGSDRLNREYYNRNETAENFVKVCQTMTELNILYMVDVILDCVYETEEDLREVARTLNRLPRPFRLLAYSMTPFPGTPFYDRVVRDGLLDRFAADAYGSVYRATRPDAYYTPEYWRGLIKYILPMRTSPTIDALIEAGPHDPAAAAMVRRLVWRGTFMLELTKKVRNKAPSTVDLMLHVYQKAKNLRRSWQRMS